MRNDIFISFNLKLKIFAIVEDLIIALTSDTQKCPFNSFYWKQLERQEKGGPGKKKGDQEIVPLKIDIVADR